MSPKNYKVIIPPHMQYMEVDLSGVVELETLRALSAETDKFIALYDEKPKIIKVIANVNKVNKVSVHSRKYGSKWLVNHPEFRIAFYGKNLFIKYILHLITKINNAKKTMRVFSSKKDALKWLDNNYSYDT